MIVVVVIAVVVVEVVVLVVRADEEHLTCILCPIQQHLHVDPRREQTDKRVDE